MTSVREIFRMNDLEVREALELIGLKNESDMINKINLCLDANKHGLLPKQEDDIVSSRYFIPNVEKYYPNVSKILDETFSELSLLKECPINQDWSGDVVDLISYDSLDIHNFIKVNNICYNKETFEKYLREWVSNKKPLEVLDIYKNKIPEDILNNYDFYLSYKDRYLLNHDSDDSYYNNPIQILNFSYDNLGVITEEILYRNYVDRNYTYLVIKLQNNYLRTFDGSILTRYKDAIILDLRGNPIENIYNLPENVLIHIHIGGAHLYGRIELNNFCNIYWESTDIDTLKNFLYKIHNSNVKGISVISSNLEDISYLHFPSNIQEIYLPKNNIQNLCIQFDEYQQLKILDLSDNNITYAALRQTKFPQTLNNINLNNNVNLSYIDNRFHNAWISIKNTQVLYSPESMIKNGDKVKFINNEIYEVDECNELISDKTIKNKMLMVSSEISRHAFDDRLAVKNFKNVSGMLNIKNCTITTLAQLSSYDFNPYLSELIIEKCGIFDMTFILNLKYLSSIQLIYNNLYEIPNLKMLKCLTSINLQENSIKYINLSFLPKSLEILYLMGNPLEEIDDSDDNFFHYYTNQTKILKIYIDKTFFSEADNNIWLKMIESNPHYTENPSVEEQNYYIIQPRNYSR